MRNVKDPKDFVGKGLTDNVDTSEIKDDFFVFFETGEKLLGLRARNPNVAFFEEPNGDDGSVDGSMLVVE